MSGEQATQKDEQVNMASFLNESPEDISEGKIIKGKVVAVKNDSVLVDIGLKAEGIIPLGEFMKKGRPDVNIGEEIEVYLKYKEGRSGHPVISFQEAVQIKNSSRIEDVFKNKLPIEAEVIKMVKGGFVVDIGEEAFLPASQADMGRINDLNSLVGKVLAVKITELDSKSGNIVVSHRVLLEEERKRKKDQTMQKLQENQICTGVVRNITNFGAFIDLGGLEGLLHISDISWGHVKKVEDFLRIGEELELKVLSFDREKEKVSLGLKQLTPYPWTNIKDKYPVDSIITGKVTNLTKFGAFVQLEEGIEGLIHISEMSWTKHVSHPSKIVSIGDIVKAKVLDIDIEKEKLSLGLKHLEPNPWEKVKDKYPLGSKVLGQVVKVAPFGAFISLEEGIEGLVHVSDFDWSGRVKNPAEVLKAGDNVETVVLSVDVKEEKISLGLKQNREDPYRKYKVGAVLKVKILRLTEFGAFVQLEEGIEGLIHISQISRQRVSDAGTVVKVGEEVTAKITDIDRQKRRIDLSIKKYEEEQEEQSIKKYVNQGAKKTTLGDVFGEQFQELLSSFEQGKNNNI
ncbi:MAG: 30S ribosomal protein S1 [bacterium]